MKKAIILDLDETLEHGNMLFDEDKTLYIMTLRPNLNKLVDRLKEIKKDDLADIILCTDAVDDWVQAFFRRCPEIKDVFDKIYSRTNKEEWQYYDYTKYVLEDYLDYKEGSQKPVTTFGYDKFLFIDDNIYAGKRLERIVQERKENNQDISFLSGFGNFWVDIERNMWLKNVSKESADVSQKYYKYLETALKDPGIDFMIDTIDDFLKRDFRPGYYEYNDKYKAESIAFIEKRRDLFHDAENAAEKLEDKLGKYFYPRKDALIKYFYGNADMVGMHKKKVYEEDEMEME